MAILTNYYNQPEKWEEQPIWNWFLTRTRSGDFPGGAVVKNPPANAGDMGSIPGLGRSHMPQSN